MRRRTKIAAFTIVKNAKVVVEQGKGRVRFVLEFREIVYDRHGFHVK